MFTLFWLLVGHALCDYPLQGDFLSRAKNHRVGIPGVPWYQALTAHALIQAAMVAFVTGVPVLAYSEFVAHWWIDLSKSAGLFGEEDRAFNIDQALHIGCKVVWVVWLLAVTRV